MANVEIKMSDMEVLVGRKEINLLISAKEIEALVAEVAVLKAEIEKLKQTP